MNEEQKCQWAYTVLEAKDPEDIENEVKNFVNNNLNKNERRTYKVAQDDRRRENAHAVIFYDKQGVIPTKVSTESINLIEFVAGGKKKKDLELICDDARDWLNGLSNEQSLSTRMVLSNSKNPKELLVFYYPDSN